MKISTRQCRSLVQARQEFQCHGSLYAKYMRTGNATMYVVYSYGEHWPLFVHHDGTWYENEDRYSRTTSCHHGKAHPHCPTILASCESLKKFIHFGLEFCPKLDRLVAVSA